MKLALLLLLAPSLADAALVKFSADEVHQRCAELKGRRVLVSGRVIYSYKCPDCPNGALCKPCGGDHYVLGGTSPETKVSVVGRARDKLPRHREFVEVEGTVEHSPDNYVGAPCMLETSK